MNVNNNLNRLYTNFPEDYKVGDVQSIMGEKVQIIGIEKQLAIIACGYSHYITYTPIPEDRILYFNEHERLLEQNKQLKIDLSKMTIDYLLAVQEKVELQREIEESKKGIKWHLW